MKTDFLDIKEGDLVIIGSWGAPRRLARVNRTTPTTFEVENRKFRKKDGCVVGSSDSWMRTSVYIPTEEDITRIKKETFVRHVYGKLSKLKEEDLTYEQAIEVHSIIWGGVK